MKIPKHLLEKYNKRLPRYTSYPPANYFENALDNEIFGKLMVNSNDQNPQNISLYIHIPFCNKICYYCGCNSMKIRTEEFTAEYVEAVKTELKLFKSLISPNRKVSQVHWGGGTPNSLPAEMILTIMKQIYSDFELIDKPEIAIECSPASLTENYVKTLHEAGFNRFSLGIQDFRTDVLNAVNREVPEKEIGEIMGWLRKKEGITVNLDFIYGLPLQTTDSFRETMKKAIELNPDRLVTFSYAHVPWFKPAQKKLEEYHLPDADEKMAMFETAVEMLKDAGYKAIGLDHFARPDDELYHALQSHSLHRNFQGYCTRETTGQVYAAGISSISQLHDGYFQNTKNIKDYMKAMQKKEPAIEKIYLLSEEQKVIRWVINELMCNFHLNWKELKEKTGKSYEEIQKICGFQEKELQTFQKDGLLCIEEEKIEVSELGKYFIRNIAASFDPLIRNTDKKFSKTI